MFPIESCPLPSNALLRTYLRKGTYTDCYKIEISGEMTHAQYVRAFYTTSVFKLERLILKWFASKPSSDFQVTQLSEGAANAFSAWNVENRCENQLLMCDFLGRTRSWLMIEPVKHERGIRTRLYFGSAVIPIKNNKTGKSSLGLGFYVLLGFHKCYSKILLYSAKSRLKRQNT